jgi:FixJ family two-component response regulator
VSEVSVSIVDDDAGNRGALASLVRSLGLSVDAFASGPAFLASPAASATACLVTDVHMPEMSGLDLQDRLRRVRPDCPVIIVTGFPTDALRQRATAGGAAGFFAKPLGADFLHCLEIQIGWR